MAFTKGDSGAAYVFFELANRILYIDQLYSLPVLRYF
jgi:hypothetical protein